MSMPPQKPGRSKQDYGTPPALLDAVRGRLLWIPQFTCDLAASAENRVAPDYFTLTDNALAPDRSWNCGPGWNWCNPPFNHLEPWVAKAYAQQLQGVRTALLVPASVGSQWWARWVHRKADVHFLLPRLTFVGQSTPYPKDCALLLYAPATTGGYALFNWKG